MNRRKSSTKNLTRREELILQEWKNGLTYEEIGKIFKVTRQRVAQIIQENKSHAK